MQSPSKLDKILGYIPQTASFTSTLISYIVIIMIGYVGYRYAIFKGIINPAGGGSGQYHNHFSETGGVAQNRDTVPAMRHTNSDDYDRRRVRHHSNRARTQN